MLCRSFVGGCAFWALLLGSRSGSCQTTLSMIPACVPTWLQTCSAAPGLSMQSKPPLSRASGEAALQEIAPGRPVDIIVARALIVCIDQLRAMMPSLVYMHGHLHLCCWVEGHESWPDQASPAVRQTLAGRKQSRYRLGRKTSPSVFARLHQPPLQD